MYTVSDTSSQRLLLNDQFDTLKPTSISICAVSIMYDVVALKDESGKTTINVTDLEQSLSCPLTPRLTQSVK